MSPKSSRVVVYTLFWIYDFISDTKIDFHIKSKHFWLVFSFSRLIRCKSSCRHWSHVPCQFANRLRFSTALFPLILCRKIFSRRFSVHELLQTLSYYHVVIDEHIEFSSPSPSHMSYFNETWLKKFLQHEEISFCDRNENAQSFSSRISLALLIELRLDWLPDRNRIQSLKFSLINFSISFHFTELFQQS